MDIIWEDIVDFGLRNDELAKIHGIGAWRIGVLIDRIMNLDCVVRPGIQKWDSYIDKR